jgi:hypothetical protein
MRVSRLVSILLLAGSLTGLNCSLLSKSCIRYGCYTADGEKVENASLAVSSKDYNEMKHFFDVADSLYQANSPKLREHLAKRPDLLYPKAKQ